MPLSTVPVPESQRRGQRWRRLHSITGIVPLALFLVWHLFVYAHALSGQAALGRAIVRQSRGPWLPAAVILVALGFHTVYGLKLTAGRWKAGRAKVVQRAAGLALLAFIAYHFFELEVPLLVGRMSAEEIYPTLAYRFSSTTASIPFYASIYLLALLAAAMHVGIGLHDLCVSAGLAATRTSQRVAAGLLGAAGLVLFLAGADIVVHFAAGANVLIPRAFLPARPTGSADCDLMLSAPAHR